MLKYTFIFLLAFLTSCSSSDTASSNYIEAEVINIMSSLTIEDKDMKVESQSARIVVKLKSGEEKDKEVVINQQIVPKINDVAIPDVGDEIVLSETILSDGNTGLQIVDVKRSGVSIFSVILLFIVMVAIGGVKGIVFSLLMGDND
ncbi:MAG: hypothetical protein EOO18_07790 [Chryseobacterium sp.]|nr:MAG: hypothetical protein EOO18_07790 [Chryseobacterium sp.]